MGAERPALRFQELLKIMPVKRSKTYELMRTDPDCEDDYQVNANLTAAIEGAGFQVGGKFANHLSTVWTMSGTFGARRKD